MNTHTTRRLNNDARRARKAVKHEVKRGYTGNTKQHFQRARWSVQRAHKAVATAYQSEGA